MRKLGLYTRRIAIFVVVAALGILAIKPSSAQEKRNVLKLGVVGIGVSDYPASKNFYEKVMGFPIAFQFSSADGKRTTTYYQTSRETFVEMQPVPDGVAPGFTHVHLVTDDLDATIARIRAAGIPISTAPRNKAKPLTITERAISSASKVNNCDVYDPDGLTLELNELRPESLTKTNADSWNKGDGLRASVIGIAVSDYPASKNFYEKVMGFPIAFQFSSPDGKRTTTYYQMSRDSFLEMQMAGGDVKPGFTHVHLATPDLNTTMMRIQAAGIPSVARNVTTAKTITQAGIAQPSNVKNSNVYDPDGLRLELNELIPESLTKKATDAWK